ncbi:hypothetical protein GCM10025734_42340 [Kitasatospora paranensis]
MGDLDKPKLVFFFDEAHLLFKGASKAFLEAITQTVRLIRSKGIGIFFVTQTPRDVPADVLGQLGNRVQHALRAFTPDDAKALKATVSTFPRSGYDLNEVLTQLGTGEAVVTVLSETGAPTPVAATRLRAPQSLMGPLDAAALRAAVDGSALAPRYQDAIDRESAYEKLTARPPAAAPTGPGGAVGSGGAAGETGEAERERGPAPRAGRAGQQEDEGGLIGSLLRSPALKSFARSAGTQLGREISRSLFGTSRRGR